MPITLVADQEFVALDDLATAFQLTIREESLGAVTVSYKGKTVVLTPDQALASVGGRLVSLWRGRFDLRVEAIVDQAGSDWFGPVGVVTRLLDGVPVTADDAAFVCGPEIMMRFAVRELDKRGVSRESIWISMERSMKCGIGLCGHCQLAGSFMCKDGPVYRFDRIAPYMQVPEL